MGIINYGSFIVAAVLLNIIPGSDTIYILSNTILGGKKQGIFSVFGISCGALVHTILATVGLSAILMTSALAFALVKWAGALYLIYLGVTTFLKKETLLHSSKKMNGNDWQIFKQGLLTNVLNPKVALFFLSLLPQYIDPVSSSSGGAFLLLGLTFIATSTIWSLLIVFGAAFFTQIVSKNETGNRLANKLAGCIYILLGLNLLRLSSNH